jgi:hypothetical protein
LASGGRFHDAQPLEGVIGILTKWRIRKLGDEFLVIVLRLIDLIVCLVDRRKFIRDGGLRVSTAVIKLFVGIDSLLRFAMFLLNRAKRKLRHGSDTGIAATRYLLKILNRFCRITESFLAERDVVQSDAAGG